MKYTRLLMLFAGVIILGVGTARAQCSEAYLLFPIHFSNGTNGDVAKVEVPSGTCIAALNQAARLRWNNNNSGLLQLFDTDEAGNQIWCNGIDAGGCKPGKSLCLQSDGNMVIYAGASCTGNAVWSSGTVGQNFCGEGLAVADGGNGEEVVIVNNIFGCASGGLQFVWQRP
jgi:hypothetical protein